MAFPRIRLGRWMSFVAGILVLSSFFLPHWRFPGDSSPFNEIAEVLRSDDPADDPEDVLDWACRLCIPYLFGAWVFARALTRADGDARWKRFLLATGAIWILLVLWIATQSACEYLAVLADRGVWARGIDLVFAIWVAGAALTAAFPLLLVVFLAWAVRWGRNSERRLRAGQIVAGLVTANGQGLLLLASLLSRTESAAAVGLWVLPAGCALAAIGALVELPPGDTTEVEREFGPRGGHPTSGPPVNEG